MTPTLAPHGLMETLYHRAAWLLPGEILWDPRGGVITKFESAENERFGYQEIVHATYLGPYRQQSAVPSQGIESIIGSTKPDILFLYHLERDGSSFSGRYVIFEVDQQSTQKTNSAAIWRAFEEFELNNSAPITYEKAQQLCARLIDNPQRIK